MQKTPIMILWMLLLAGAAFSVCNESFSSYVNFTINNSNATLSSYPLFVRMNVSGIGGVLANTNGSDYVVFNGAAPVPFCFDSANDTDFTFYLNGTLSTGNTTLQMCFGNSNLPVSVSNCTKVYGPNITRVYPFDARTTDIISRVNGTLSASNPTVVPGRRGDDLAFHFNAALSQYISASDAGLPTGTNESTMCAWFQSNQTATQVLLGYGNHAGFQDRNSIGTAGPMIGGTATDGGESTSGESYLANNWTLECLLVNGTQWSTCVNGGAVCSTPTDLPSTDTVLGGASGLVFGAYGTGALFYTGNIQDPMIWNRALTGDEMDSLYAAVEPTYSFGAPRSMNTSINIVEPVNSSIHGSLTFLLDINATGDNIERVSYEICAVGAMCGTAKPSWTNYTAPINITLGSSRWWKVNAYAQDIFGRITDAETIYFLLDADAPLISIISPTNTSYNSTNVYLDLNITDDLSGVNKTFYSLNGGANQTYTAPLNITAANGGNSLVVWANDSAGNSNTSTIIFTVQTHVPTATAVIVPTVPVWYENMTCYSNLSDMNLTGPLKGNLSWFLNGNYAYSVQFTGQFPGSTVSGALTSGATMPGDVVICQAFVDDGFYSFAINSTPRTAVSVPAPLATSVSLTPLNPTTNSTLFCQAMYSYTGYAPVIWSVFWYLNGTLMPMLNSTGSGAPIIVATGGGLNAGDNWSCSVSLTDTLLSSGPNFSVNRTIGPTYAAYFNGSITNITLSDFETHMTQFYQDWSPYIYAILSFGFSFMLTNRYSQTLIGGGIGLIFIFFFMGNPVFLAGGIFSILMGYLMKYLTG